MRLQAEDNLFFEDVITAIYSALLKPGDTCLDGGAHTGLHTLPMARIVGADGTVFAVEPLPDARQTLEATLAAKARSNVRVIPNPLFSESRPVSFNVIAGAPTRSSIALIGRPADTGVEEISMTAVRIDDVLEKVESCRFWKLDLEGGEFTALQGGRNALSRLSPFVVFERSVGAAASYGYTPEEFFEFFRMLGYATFDLFGSPLELSDWSTPGRPWYAIAVKRGSDDERFLRDGLPHLLRDMLRLEEPAERLRPPAAAAGPFILAVPNPVPAGSDQGTTVVHWDIGDELPAEVRFSVNGEQERLFFRSPHGARAAPWIQSRCTYEFRLYRADANDVLAAVTVTRRRGLEPPSATASGSPGK